MPTKDQLRSIEWAGRGEQGASCPACCGPRITGHHPRCWLALELATPDTLPPVEVGDVVAFLQKLVDHGEWYVSAIELDHHVDGEVLREELEQLLALWRKEA